MFVQRFHASHIEIRGAPPHVCMNRCSNARANGCRGDPSLHASRSLRANRKTKVMMQRGEKRFLCFFILRSGKGVGCQSWCLNLPDCPRKPWQQRGGWSGAKNNLLRIKTLPSTSPAEVSEADGVKNEEEEAEKERKKKRTKKEIQHREDKLWKIRRHMRSERGSEVKQTKKND